MSVTEGLHLVSWSQSRRIVMYTRDRDRVRQSYNLAIVFTQTLVQLKERCLSDHGWTCDGSFYVSRRPSHRVSRQSVRQYSGFLDWTNI